MFKLEPNRGQDLTGARAGIEKLSQVGPGPGERNETRVGDDKNKLFFFMQVKVLLGYIPN